jgi:hypothetical protein
MKWSKRIFSAAQNPVAKIFHLNYTHSKIIFLTYHASKEFYDKLLSHHATQGAKGEEPTTPMNFLILKSSYQTLQRTAVSFTSACVHDKEVRP